jgi:hypothetical protein
MSKYDYQPKQTEWFEFLSIILVQLASAIPQIWLCSYLDDGRICMIRREHPMIMADGVPPGDCDTGQNII